MDSEISVRETIVPFQDFGHEFLYSENGEKTFFQDDKIRLRRNFGNEELLSLSFGLAQSAKLQVYEEAIDQLVEETQVLPKHLADSGSIHMSKRELKQHLGKLLTARYSVSLLSDILDTPDYFWEHPELEDLHIQCRSQVELNKRIRLLSSRMDIIKDSLDVINTELAQSSTHRVELYIVSLIAVEVMLELFKLYFGH